jgi:CRP-like cAMP-binding protein
VSAQNDPAGADDLNNYFVSANAGEFIFRELDQGTDMFIIRNGQVELLKQYAGRPRQIAMLEVGDFFGEMSLLEELPREVSARAVGPVDLLRIDATTFDRIVQEAPEVPVRMLRKLCQRLREYQQHEARALAIAGASLPSDGNEPESLAVDLADGDVHADGEPSARGGTAVLVDPVSQTLFELTDRPEFTVGRLDRLTGFTPDIDLTSLDGQRTLSRRHAKILSRDGDYYLREEMGVRNGTFVNGERLQTGVEMKLSDGDRIRFGLIETVFELR